MKSSVAGLIMAGIVIFNIFFLLVYFFLKFRKHDRKLEEEEGD